MLFRLLCCKMCCRESFHSQHGLVLLIKVKSTKQVLGMKRTHLNLKERRASESVFAVIRLPLPAQASANLHKVNQHIASPRQGMSES